MRAPVSAIVAMAAITSSASAFAAGSWKPEKSMIAKLETRLTMPDRAYGPLSTYTRYYAGVVRDGRKVIEGELARLTRTPASPGGVNIVRFSDFPNAADAGCGIITFSYDVQANSLSSPTCGSENPQPPPAR